MNDQQQPKRSIDERIDAMAQTMELIQAESLASSRRIDALTATVKKHEQDWQRFRRAMRAALAEWFSDDGDNGDNGDK